MPDLSQLWIFWVSFIMLVAAGIGIPIPEELPVIGAGIWAANAPPEIRYIRWLILPTCIVGILISDVLLYGIGRYGGRRILKHRWVAKLYTPDKREQIEKNFAHYGIKILLVVRWIPGIRSPMFITAGLMRVPLWQFIIADAVAATMGHTLLFFAAYWFGDAFRDLVVRAEEEVDKLRPILVITALIAVALFFLIRYLRRPVTTADPKEVPLIGEKVAAGIESLEHKTGIFHLGKEQGAGVRSQGAEARGQELENHQPAPMKETEKARPPAADA